MQSKVQSEISYRQPWFLSILCVAMGLVLAFSGFAHLQNPFLFLDSVLAYKVVDGNLAWATAVMMPFLEIGLAVLWFSNLRATCVAAFSTALFATFLIAQASVIIRGISIDCGCFGGVIEREVGMGSVLFLLGLVSVSVFVMIVSSLRGDPNPQPTSMFLGVQS